MKSEKNIFLNHINDLANNSFKKNVYTFTHFLSPSDQSEFAKFSTEFNFVEYSMFGGFQDSERKILRFGSEASLGYSENYPIAIIRITPLLKKFSDVLTHRDFLGAILNLGLERDTVGDIIIKDNEAFVAVMDHVAEVIDRELSTVKHTTVGTKIMSVSDYEESAPEQEFIVMKETLSSERADLIISRVTRLARGKALELFRTGLVTVNGKTFENNSGVLKPGDIFSVRGYGKFIYDGCDHKSKKDKYVVTIRKYK